MTKDDLSEISDRIKGKIPDAIDGNIMMVLHVCEAQAIVEAIEIALEGDDFEQE